MLLAVFPRTLFQKIQILLQKHDLILACRYSQELVPEMRNDQVLVRNVRQFNKTTKNMRTIHFLFLPIPHPNPLSDELN